MRKDILITGKSGFIGKRINRGVPFKGRISRLNLLMQTNTHIKGIVHLAAKANKRNCDNNPKQCIESNLIALCDVLEVALFRDIWVLFVSTYQVREQALYGLSKLFGEELCRLYQDKGLNVTIMRLPIVYGPNDKEDKVVTKLIGELKRGIAPKIRTTRKFYFAYVDDVAKRIENEVDFSLGKKSKQYSLIELTEGIKKCLKEEKKK